MKVVVIGSRGQLGQELLNTAPTNLQLIAVDQDTLDIYSKEQLQRFVIQQVPDVIINAAAYTAVDKAESESELAFAINAESVGLLAELAYEHNVRLIHISTDFVFDGKKSTPYTPEDTPNPLSVYGASKFKGEQLALEKTSGRALIIRTAWLYSAHGSNFVKTVLRLMQERESLSVVADQFGTPTSARGLAKMIWTATQRPDMQGIYHWTDAGVASWYDFAMAIQEEANACDLIKKTIPILPIATSSYPTPAVRPSYSVLDKSACWHKLEIVSPHWRVALRELLRELKAAGTSLTEEIDDEEIRE